MSRPSETTSVTTTTSNAPASRQASDSAVKSRTRPKKSGFWTTTQAVSPSIRAVRFSAPDQSGPGEAISIPKNRALVSVTSR